MIVELLIVIILVVICETTAIGCIKKYHNQDGARYLFLVIALYALVCILIERSLRYKNSMGMINVLWSGISVFAVASAGILFFKEKLHVHDIIAGALITAGIVIYKYTE